MIKCCLMELCRVWLCLIPSLFETCQDEERNKEFGSAYSKQDFRTLRDWGFELDDRNVGVFAARIYKQSVHLIKAFLRRDAMVLQAIGSAFVLKDTRFRTNKSCVM